MVLSGVAQAMVTSCAAVKVPGGGVNVGVDAAGPASTWPLLEPLEPLLLEPLAPPLLEPLEPLLLEPLAPLLLLVPPAPPLLLVAAPLVPLLLEPLPSS